jgi:hypothetical protein
MAPACLTVLAALRPGTEVTLHMVLRTVGDDINEQEQKPGTPRVHFVRSERLHFARFAILDDPDRGPGARRLLFASVYDGTLEQHVTELHDITSDLDAIWGFCEGYTGAATFLAFVRAHALTPAAYYVAFRDETVASIRHAIAVSKQPGAMEHAGEAGQDPSRSIRAFFSRLVRAAPIVVDILRAVARFGIGNVFVGGSKIVASLNRYALLRLFNVVTGNRLPPRRSPFSSVGVDNCGTPAPLAPGDEVPSVLVSLPSGFREDVVTQNQLTLVTVIDDGRADEVGAVMAAIDAYARRLSPPGSLTGISTIHFVRWLIIDHGRRLLFISDYDNSWENYIDEFAEMILSGLDAIWGTAVGYPRDGARDLPAFKRFLRWHQVPSAAFYSAYPEETVLNIIADTRLARQTAS